MKKQSFFLCIGFTFQFFLVSCNSQEANINSEEIEKKSTEKINKEDSYEATCQWIAKALQGSRSVLYDDGINLNRVYGLDAKVTISDYNSKIPCVLSLPSLRNDKMMYIDLGKMSSLSIESTRNGGAILTLAGVDIALVESNSKYSQNELWLQKVGIHWLDGNLATRFESAVNNMCTNYCSCSMPSDLY